MNSHDYTNLKTVMNIMEAMAVFFSAKMYTS